MARIHTDGAEFGDLLAWSTATCTADTTRARTGTYSYKTASASAYGTINVLDLTAGYVRYAWYFTGAANPCYIDFRHSTTTLVRVDINAGTNLLQAKVSTTVVATGTTSVPSNEWNLYEVYVSIADAGGRIVVKMNGVTEIDYTGDTKPGADTHFDVIYFYISGSNNSWLDDIAVDDADWCGDGHIELLTPNGNGDTNNWTGSDGDSVNNYLLVDDIPPNSDTDYVKSSTALQQDMYNLTDFTATGKVVTRIFAEVRAKDNDVTGGQIKLGFKTGGTVYLSAAARSLTGNYARFIGDYATVDPGDSNPWSDTDLDNIQLVLECE